MIRPVLLDSGPLGRIAHPKRNPEIKKWLGNLLAANVTVILPEIADYEVRRNLLLEGLERSLDRLDALSSLLT